MLNPVRRGQRQVRFVVNGASHEGDGHARNDFLDENYGPTPGIIRPAPDIKPQIDFLEMAMEGDGNSADPGFLKKKADEADKGFTIPKIQLRSCGHEWRENFRVNLIIQHRQMTPFGGQ